MVKNIKIKCLEGIATSSDICPYLAPNWLQLCSRFNNPFPSRI